MLKWAAFQYRNTYNLGDEIQTIAALQFTPEPSYRIDRDFLAQFTPPESDDVAIIVNGWFSHCAENFCVQPRLTPLLISLHFSSSVGLGALGISATDALRQPAMIDYLNRWAPSALAIWPLTSSFGIWGSTHTFRVASLLRFSVLRNSINRITSFASTFQMNAYRIFAVGRTGR